MPKRNNDYERDRIQRKIRKYAANGATAVIILTNPSRRRRQEIPVSRDRIIKVRKFNK